MTICVSALCENEKKVVVIVDRMMTQEALSLEFEQGLCKIENLCPTCVVTTAGDALEPKDIFRDARGSVEQLTHPTIRQIVDIVKREFILCRKRNVEDQVLKPRGFESLEQFYEKMRGLPPDVYSVIDDRIERFHLIHDTSMAMIITGIDHLGAHLYLIFDPGRSKCFDSVGFHAIGSGTPHAISVFTSYNHTGNTPLNQALWIAYEAKRRAERAPGVGKGTDMCIVDGNGVKHVSEELLQTLNTMYEEKDKKDREWLEKLPNILPQDKESKD